MMTRSFRAELQKSRRRHDWLVAAGIALVVVLWASVTYDLDTPEELASCYSALYFAVPLMNAIVMPVGMAALASRIWDSETKGETCKLLFTLQSRESLFCGKAALGMLENLLVCLIEVAGVWALGLWKGSTQAPDPVLAVGFCGALIGLFAAYMPTWFGYFVPFGYYVPLNGVLMSWDRDTRITTFYLTDFRWWLLGVTVLLGLLCAAACRRSIQTKEV